MILCGFVAATLIHAGIVTRQESPPKPGQKGPGSKEPHPHPLPPTGPPGKGPPGGSPLSPQRPITDAIVMGDSYSGM